MKQILATLALSLVLPAQVAVAQSQDVGPAAGLVVVELFTSQGCAACPPADEMMAELSGRDDILALSLHVDYWNYLGWEDTFSQAVFTERQYGYGRSAGSTMVYTPQLIIGGQDRVMGARPMEVIDLLAVHRAAPRPISFEMRPDGDGIRVSASWTGAAGAPAMIVQLVRYSPREVVEITRGENAGRTAEYYNVARQWQVLAEWDGSGAFVADVPVQPELHEAIIVQTAGHGPILGAARID